MQLKNQFCRGNSKYCVRHAAGEDDQKMTDSLVPGDDSLEGVGSRRNPGKDDIP